MKNRITTLLLSISALFAVGCQNELETQKYRVGDYYTDGFKEGIIFYLDPSGLSGKIVSLTEANPGLAWTTDPTANNSYIGALDENNGERNMSVVKGIFNWKAMYPAFKWCDDLGDDWYLPSIGELELLTLNHSVRYAVNRGLKAKGGDEIQNIGTSAAWNTYWSSTEYLSSGLYNHARCVDMTFGESSYEAASNRAIVRAVAKFSDADSGGSGVQKPEEQKIFKVGDYYEKDGKKGVVFYVEAAGEHGKIVSLTESTAEQAWGVGIDPTSTFIGAYDQNYGANNMAKVKAIADWKSLYPAFAWCLTIGEQWYLPAINELMLLTTDSAVHSAVNKQLISKGGVALANINDSVWYWSSTEVEGSYSYNAYYMDMFSGTAGDAVKSTRCYIRAVTTF